MMEKFVYTAYDAAGIKYQDELPAINRQAVTRKLKEMGLIPVKIKKLDASKKFTGILTFNRQPNFFEVEFFTSQLSILLKGGIKIDRSLEIVKKGIKNNRLRKILEGIYENIRRGEKLSRALEKYPDVFDPLYVSIASIGEATGHLPEAFSDIADNLNFRMEVLKKTRQAMVYPSIIFTVCLLSIIFIFNFIVPKFSVIFAGMEELPVYTNILLLVSAIFRKYQFIILAAAIGFLVIIMKIKKRDVFRRGRDALVLKLPLTRQLCYNLENLRFTSSLAILLRSGVVLTEALDYAIKSIGNLLIQKQMTIVKEEIKQGKKLSESLAKINFLPEIFNGIIEVGEQTGDLAGVFFEMEKRLKDTYESRVTGLVNLIEPIMILFMGLVVGSVVVVMLLSMVSISDINF